MKREDEGATRLLGARASGRFAASSPRRVTASLLYCLMVVAVLGACKRDTEQSLTRAVEAWDSGDYKRAAEEYELYLNKYPAGEQSPEARFQLANIYYFKLGRHDQARANYTAFLEQNSSNPNAPLARERLAEVLGEMGRSYEAIAEYENLSPRDSGERRRVRLRIADLYFAQRNYSQALTEYEKVIEQVAYDELSEQAYLREASIYHIERGQYQQALPVYQQLASMSGDPKVRVRAMYGLADCYAGLYQFDDAIRTLRVLKDDAGQSEISRRVAELEQQKREAAQAGSGLPPDLKNGERPKTATIEASKSEKPEPIKAEKADPEKPDRAEVNNRRKAESTNVANSNAVKRSESRRASNTQAENSNTAGKSKSPKPANVN